MEGKRVEKIVKITIFIVCVLFLLMVLWPAIFGYRRHPSGLHSNYLARRMETMFQYFEQYYNENNSKDEVKASEVVQFLANDCDKFSKYTFSGEQKQSLHSDPIYFCLPKELKSDFPTIIAYSGPIQEKNKKMYRTVLFLNGNDIKAISIENRYIEYVLGVEQLRRASKPDLYIQLPPRR